MQCGDIGAYPDIENLDKATIKHAQYDRDELGFYDNFTKTNPDIKAFLDELNINMICVRGNHEDHDFLDKLEKENHQNKLFPIDILITHDKGDSSERGCGMTEIREVLDNVIFHYHFYGHTGEPFNQETDFNGITQSIKIKELEFNESGILEKGCMVILEKKNNAEPEIEIADQKLTSKLTKDNWKI